MKKTAFAALLSLAFAAPVSAKKAREAALAAVGKSAPEFTAVDSRGKTRELTDYKGKVVVLEWFNYDCPFSRKHYRSGNMQALQKSYTARGVVWLSVVSSAEGKQGYYPPEELNRKSRELEASPTAILPDPTGALGHLYDAKTTPHMFVINRKGILAYAGAIDDKPSTDLEDIKTAHNYVHDALEALLLGDPVKTSYTKSYGCSVKY